MGKVIAVCVSEQKGTQKQNVGSAHFLTDWGIEYDAHAGKWHRQVSLLSHNRVEEFRARGRMWSLAPSEKICWWRALTSKPCLWAPGSAATA